jgi:hypothetical protein
MMIPFRRPSTARSAALLGAAALMAAGLVCVPDAGAQTQRFTNDRAASNSDSADALRSRDDANREGVTRSATGDAQQSRTAEDLDRRAFLGRAGFIPRTVIRFDGRLVVGGSVVFTTSGDTNDLVYSAVRTRTDSRIFNPRPAERSRPVRFTGSELGSTGDTVGRRFNTDSPTGLGAPDGALDQLIYVRTRDDLPPIAISPWQEVTEENIDELIRRRPFLRSSNRDELLDDLRAGRAQWLRENGYAGSPRTFVNAEARDRAAEREQAGAEREASDEDRPGLGPDSFIRIRPAEPREEGENAERDTPTEVAEDDSDRTDADGAEG